MMKHSFFCPICHAPINGKEVVCDSCRKELDGECFDSLMYRCPICHFPRLSEDYLCERCAGGTKAHYTIFPVSRYDGKLNHSVLYSFKFHGHKELSRVVALYLKRALSVLDPENKALLVPVPCSEARLLRYGWDHMIEVCKALDRPFLTLIANREEARQQKTMDREQRIISSYGKFMLNPEYLSGLEELRCRKVIVIDDIATTMSTMLSAIGLLESIGFTDVSGATWLCEI